MKRLVVLSLIMVVLTGCVGLIDTVHFKAERVNLKELEGTWASADSSIRMLFPDDEPSTFTIQQTNDGMYRFTGTAPIGTAFEAFLFVYDGRIYAECIRKNIEYNTTLHVLGTVPLRYLLELQVSSDSNTLSVREPDARKIVRIARYDESVGIVERGGWVPVVTVTGHRNHVRRIVLNEDVLKPTRTSYYRVSDNAVQSRGSE